MTPSCHLRSRGRMRRAFTLIELLIVIAILLAIGGIVLVNLLPAKDQADIDLTRVQIDTFEQALKRFRVDLKRWPTEDEGLAVLWNPDGLEDENDQAAWKGPYLEKAAPLDTWKQAWIYHQPSELREGAEYDIISMGPDKEEGTDDDIHNHMRELNAQGEYDEEFDMGGAGGGTSGTSGTGGGGGTGGAGGGGGGGG
jgi:general secretion pathway protein G